MAIVALSKRRWNIINTTGVNLCLIRPGLYRRQQGVGSEKINQEKVNCGKGEEIRTNKLKTRTKTKTIELWNEGRQKRK